MYLHYIFSYFAYFLILASFWFAILFVLSVLLFALREAFKLQPVKGGCSTRSYSSISHIFIFLSQATFILGDTSFSTTDTNTTITCYPVPIAKASSDHVVVSLSQ